MSLVATDDISKVRSADRSTYRSMPVMTKYEFDQLIGLRTMHLARGAPPLVDVPEDYKIHSNMELRNIAIRELKEKKMPYIVKRPMPNGKTEYWRVEDLDLIAVTELMRDY
jgi:DNA-directed RNA polymerases I, II, and III subunit RPABC2